MFQLTFCGGAEVRLRDDSNFVITIMGGTEVRLPTMAEKILRLKAARAGWRAGGPSAVRRTTVLTLMGATEWLVPTIAEEIEAMVKLRESGTVTDSELYQLWQEVLRHEEMDKFETYTFMGGTGEARPEVKDEIKALQRLAVKGLLSTGEVEELRDMLRGKSQPQMRLGYLQQKLRNLLLPPAAPKEYSTNPLDHPRHLAGE